MAQSRGRNTGPKKAPSSFSLVEAREEVGVEPFTFDVDENTSIVIEGPSTEELKDALDPENAENEERTLLEVLCGDQYDAVWEVLKVQPPKVTGKFTEHLLAYFTDGSLGGTSASQG